MRMKACCAPVTGIKDPGHAVRGTKNIIRVCSAFRVVFEGIRRDGSKGAGKINGNVTGVCEAGGSRVALLGGGQGEAGETIGVRTGAALTVLKCVRVRRQELQPSLNAWVMLANFGHLFQAFVIGMDDEFHIVEYRRSLQMPHTTQLASSSRVVQLFSLLSVARLE